MKEIIKKNENGNNLSVLAWAEDIELNALAQIKNLSYLPFAFDHIAIMPDVHMGYGMPIGGILATKDVIIPNAVGVDIGCGVSYTQTNMNIAEGIDIKAIMQKIRELIPVGFDHKKKPCGANDMPDLEKDFVIENQYQSATHQLGTLGGGNHFLEIQKDEEGFIGIMIHSGSRNLGFKVAEYYNKIAKDADNAIAIPANWELDYLDLNGTAGKNYIKAMNYCLEFARLNRRTMMNNIKSVLYDFDNKVIFSNDLDCHHNYASEEEHFGEKVIVHRKGAISAQKDESGIIPGSQGTASCIVKGLGNPNSFNSSSHGSGRLMGRGQAIKTLDLEKEQELLNSQGIIHAIRNKKDLDEAPSAYKNIENVISQELDLIKPILKLKPVGVIKG